MITTIFFVVKNGKPSIIGRVLGVQNGAIFTKWRMHAQVEDVCTSRESMWTNGLT